jgi:hypothetical protein
MRLLIKVVDPDRIENSSPRRISRRSPPPAIATLSRRTQGIMLLAFLSRRITRRRFGFVLAAGQTANQYRARRHCR